MTPAPAGDAGPHARVAEALEAIRDECLDKVANKGRYNRDDLLAVLTRIAAAADMAHGEALDLVLLYDETP